MPNLNGMIFAPCLWAVAACSAETVETTNLAPETQIDDAIVGYIHHVHLLTSEERRAPSEQKQFALLYSKYDQCDLQGEKACPLRNADVLLLSGVRVEYSLCNQYARTVEFSNRPVEYGFFGSCENGVTETFLAMKQLMGMPIPELPFIDLTN